MHCRRNPFFFARQARGKRHQVSSHHSPAMCRLPLLLRPSRTQTVPDSTSSTEEEKENKAEKKSKYKKKRKGPKSRLLIAWGGRPEQSTAPLRTCTPSGPGASPSPSASAANPGNQSRLLLRARSFLLSFLFTLLQPSHRVTVSGERKGAPLPGLPP